MADETATAELSDAASALAERVRAAFPNDSVIEVAEAVGTLVVRVRAEAWLDIAKACRNQLGFDYLSFISGLDWMPMPAATEDAGGDTSAPVQPKEQTPGVAGAAGRFQVFAHVEDTRTPRSGLTLKADVDDATPAIASWTSVYPGADWHERECFEMYGFDFPGHPALRHIYLPFDFEGHPLRKDFPLLAREVKPWPGLVDVEAMPGESDDAAGDAGDGA